MSIQNLYALFLETSGISTDTRKIKKDSMFFALKGDNFNGNAFAEEAISKGAKYCIVDEKEHANNTTTFYVPSCLETLQKLATYHRKVLQTKIIALTGSNGKTTTKELIYAVLQKQFNCLATQGNLNNHIGVPLSLLRLKPETEIAVIEMGANHQKEIENLCNIALPNFGLITNFGKAHLEGFGGVEGVIKGKSEMYDHLKEHGGLIFVNNNDQKQLEQLGTYSNVFKFGNTPYVDLTIKQVETESEFVSLCFNGTTINSNLVGNYNLNNIAYAISIGKYFGISNENIKAAIASFVPDNNRSQILEIKGNSIILDAYNANPSSMMAALKNFQNKSQKDAILILGDMFELGKSAEEEHQAIVDYAERYFVGDNYFVGKNFFKTSTRRSNSLKLETFDDLAVHISKSKISNSHLLIKGSRGMALERILDYL